VEVFCSAQSASLTSSGGVGEVSIGAPSGGGVARS
jgi:hypothetical protein